MAASSEEIRRAAMAELARRELARRQQRNPRVGPQISDVYPRREAAGPLLHEARPSMPPLDIAKGFADVGIAGFRGAVNKPASSLVGLVGGIDPNDTYRAAQDRFRSEVAKDQSLIHDDRLRTPEGEIISTVLAASPKIGPGAILPLATEAAGGLIEKMFGPEARDFAGSAATVALAGAPRLLGAAEVGAGAPRRAPVTAQDVANRAPAGGSAGAAAAATNVSNVTPGMGQAIVDAGKGGRAVSAEALARHVEADTLPVPIRLTAGEATQDVALLSNERNLRGKHPDMAARMDETNRALGQNLNAIRDDVGQNVFSTNHVEHGETIIKGYLARDASANQAINVLYHRLRQAAGGDIPVDARVVLNNATAQLHKKLLFDHAPREIMRTLTRLAKNNSMTFENFESMRTNLARIARSTSADGNVKAAAGVIRDALESIPLRQGSEHLKDIADAARAAARRRFQEIEADPAYEAAVNGTVPADRFVQKFILAAPRDQLAVMAKAFSNDPTVRQTISVAALDYLRVAARLDPGYNGNFSSAGFSRALQAIDPKANLIFDAGAIDTLSKLRNVAGYTTVQPRGSFVNNSNTLVGALAKPAAAAAEGIVNFQFGGLPVGTAIRNRLENASSRRMIQNSLQQGAGLRVEKKPKP